MERKRRTPRRSPKRPKAVVRRSAIDAAYIPWRDMAVVRLQRYSLPAVVDTATVIHTPALIGLN